MPSFEEEALARAQQLSHARQRRSQERQRPRESKKEEKEEIPEPLAAPEPKPVPKPEPKPRHAAPEGGILDIFFKDKERSVILMLLLLLMDEKTDAGLLIALVYLLI